ncbi:Serine/threonine-protein kinase PLK1 [Mortierella hygrophila]|uniref:Serine/threonine-protein kinase PLK1 n=1 Tax=Mortierella hygrophila TaxID=979708 RepID=A0A9P6F1R4_9FUNG|nr:Serine/threonine-protein kinase PLK1 [Mortierella hygrophila]
MNSSSSIHSTHNSDKALNDNHPAPNSTNLPSFYDCGSDGEGSCGAGGSSGDENDYGEKVIQRQPRRQRTPPPPLKTVTDKAANKTYRQTHLLGEGSFGHVHVAVDETGEKVALKTFKIFDMEEADVSIGFCYCKRAEQEWQACKTILDHQPHHPNVVTPISYFKDGMFPCLTMELCSNKTVDTLLEARGSLQEHEVRYFGQQLVAGVAHLHSLNLVHHDLKPLNLFLTKELVLKVGDFGQTQDPRERKKLLNVVGTPGFQAPEVLNREGHTCALDIFAIGAILFRMLFGITYQLPGKRVPLKINGSLSPNVRDLLQRTLESDPGNRIAMPDLLAHPFLTDGPVPQSVSWDILRTVAPLPTEDDASDPDGAYQVEVIKSQEEEDTKTPEEQIGSQVGDSVKEEGEKREKGKDEEENEEKEEEEEEAQTHEEATQTSEVAESSEPVVDSDDIDLDDIFEQVEEAKKAKRAKKVWDDDSDDDKEEEKDEGEEKDGEEEKSQTQEVTGPSEPVVDLDDVDLDDIFEQVEEAKKAKRAKEAWEDDSDDDDDEEEERAKGRKKAKVMQKGAVREEKAPEDKDGGHGGDQDYWHTYLRR